MKKESNSKTNIKTNSKKEKISLDALEMITGGIGEGFGQFTDIVFPSIWGNPHSKNEKGRLTG